MRRFIFVVTLLLLKTFSFGQGLQRQSNETAEQYAIRSKPGGSVVTHKIIETKWNSVPVIIAFYDQTYKLPKQNDPDQQEYQRIVTQIFIGVDSLRYNPALIDTIYGEGGAPNIETVFFANADKDKEKELVLIVSWRQQHHDVSGTLYGTFIFDNLTSIHQKRLNYLKDISKQLDGGCDCDWSDGTSKKAKFKTAKEIQKRLLQLGYKT